MNNKQRKKLQRAIEHRAAQRSELRFERKITAALSGCSLNVARATSAPSLRDKHETDHPLLCSHKLHYVRPEATHVVNARQKMRGKSRPLI